MEQLILTIKDSSKMSFLMQLINQLDFVEVEKIKRKRVSTKYNFFNSAGFWEKREISAKQLRKQACDRTK